MSIMQNSIQDINNNDYKITTIMCVF